MFSHSSNTGGYFLLDLFSEAEQEGQPLACSILSDSALFPPIC